MRTAVRLACLLLVAAAFAQDKGEPQPDDTMHGIALDPSDRTDQPDTTPTQRLGKKQVAEAIRRVRSGDFNGYHVEVILEAGAVEAIPDLERQFGRTAELLDKAKIAQVLLALGDRKDVYWDFLTGLLNPVLESDAPNPAQYDSAGKSIPGLSHEYTTWVTAHGQDPGLAGEAAVYIYPGYVMLVGLTRDQRAIPLLRGALASPNDLIAAAAALGLAEFHDAASVPKIITRCQGAASDAASFIAEYLVYFDDPQSQAAVDKYFPSEIARALRKARAAGGGPLRIAPSPK